MTTATLLAQLDDATLDAMYDAAVASIDAIGADLRHYDRAGFDDKLAAAQERARRARALLADVCAAQYARKVAIPAVRDTACM